MLTRDERNERRRKSRFSETHARYQSLLHTLLYNFERMRREHWSNERYIAWRNEWFKLDRVPQHVRERLQGATDTLFAQLYRHDLTFCYPHPDTRVLTPASVLCDAGLASRLANEEGDHCYRNEDGTYTDKF